MDVPFIDFHTHCISKEENVLSCLCCTLPLHDQTNLTHPFLQLGIHPWFLNKAQEQMDELKLVSKKHTVLAIGEIGLDKMKGGEWSKQRSVFKQQVEWAKEIQKPIVIHCVKAFDEILAILKHTNFEQAVIFHGFYGSKEQAIQLSNKGYYLSFGVELFKGNKKAIGALQQIPLNRLLLETDSASYSITELYNKAAHYLNMTVKELKLQQLTNFNTLFPNHAIK